MPKEHCAAPACEAASHASRLALMPPRSPPVERYQAGEARTMDVPRRYTATPIQMPKALRPTSHSAK
eukprot:15441448-Alexandrium_andersonii.AAC.1